MWNKIGPGGVLLVIEQDQTSKTGTESMSRKVVVAGSFAGITALAIGIAAYKALTESTEPGDPTSSTAVPDRVESHSTADAVASSAA